MKLRSKRQLTFCSRRTARGLQWGFWLPGSLGNIVLGLVWCLLGYSGRPWSRELSHDSAIFAQGAEDIQ